MVTGNTAAHRLAMIVKQLKALGIPYLHNLAGMLECFGSDCFEQRHCFLTGRNGDSLMEDGTCHVQQRFENM